MPISYRRWDGLVDSSDEETESAVCQSEVKDEPMQVPPPSTSAPAHATALSTDALQLHLGQAAICSTMKDVGGRIDSWVRWHLWLGFSRLYIFFDNADETQSVELARSAGGAAVVTLVRGSEALRAAWTRQSSWASMGAEADTSVQTRQLLNVQLAMELARTDGQVWLLHIDSDELFLPLSAESSGTSPPFSGAGVVPCDEGAAARHFATLAAAGCECFVYHNFESVVESTSGSVLDDECPGADPFAAIDTFKRCVALVPWRESAAAAAALETWRRCACHAHAMRCVRAWVPRRCVCMHE